jgi:hypothetical protein
MGHPRFVALESLDRRVFIRSLSSWQFSCGGVELRP